MAFPRQWRSRVPQPIPLRGMRPPRRMAGDPVPVPCLSVASDPAAGHAPTTASHAQQPTAITVSIRRWRSACGACARPTVVPVSRSADHATRPTASIQPRRCVDRHGCQHKIRL
jgi:hypothetical protein